MTADDRANLRVPVDDLAEGPPIARLEVDRAAQLLVEPAKLLLAVLTWVPTGDDRVEDDETEVAHPDAVVDRLLPAPRQLESLAEAGASRTGPDIAATI
jgi:hypothetical protein